MAKIALSAAPTVNVYPGMIAYFRGVSRSSAETFPTLVEAIPAAAIKMLALPGREAAGSEQKTKGGRPDGLPPLIFRLRTHH